MATQRLFTRMRKAAQNDDELWDADAEQRVRESTERINRENLEKYGTENPTTEDITGVPLHPEETSNEATFAKFAETLDKFQTQRNNPFTSFGEIGQSIAKGISLLDPNGDKALLTTEQKVNYANNNIANLSDEDKNKLNEYNDILDELDASRMSLTDNFNPEENERFAANSQRLKDLKASLQQDLNLDDETFNKYVSSSKFLKNLEDRQRQQEEYANASAGEKALANIGDALLAPIRPYTTLKGYLDEKGNPYYDENLGVDHNATGFDLANISRDVTTQATKDIEKLTGADEEDASLGSKAANEVLKTLYTGVKSGADSMARLATGEVSTLLGAGLEAADQQYVDAQERGLTKAQAIGNAVASGAAETVFEKIPVDNMMKLWKNGAEGLAKGGVKSAVKEILQQAGLEGMEEVETDIANKFSDAIINKDKSEFNTQVEEYKAQGMDEKEAFGRTLLDNVADTVESFAGGAIGGLVGGGGAIAGSVATTKEAKKLDGNYREVAQAIPDNVEDYQDEEAYNKAMEVKARAEELDTQDKVSSADRTGLLQDIYAVNETMPNVDLIENINESVNSPFADVGGFQVAKNDITSQQVAESMAQANNVNDFVEAYRDSQASSDAEARQTGQQYFNTLSPKFYTYDEGSRLLDDAMSENTADELYTMALNGEEVAPELLNTQRKADYYNQGAERRNNLIELQNQLQEQRKAQELAEKESIGQTKIKKVETPQGKADIADISINNDGSFVWKKGEEEVVIPKKDISDKAMQQYMEYATSQPTLRAKQLYADNYTGSMPIGNYNMAFTQAFNAGRGNSYKTFKQFNNAKPFFAKQIPVETLEAFYNEGKRLHDEESKKSTVNKDRRGKSVEKKGTGKVTYDKSIKKNDPIVKKAELIAKITGLDVEIVGGDIYEERNGEKVRVKGQFKPNLSKIIISQNTRVNEVLDHEGIGEFMEAYNPEDMKEIQDLLLNYLFETNASELQEEIDKMHDLYRKVNPDTSMRDAANEVVNNALSGVFSSEEGIQKLADYAYKNDKQSAFEKLVQFIKDLVNKIKSLVDNEGLNKQAERVAKMEQQRLEELQDKILNALTKARENYENTTTEEATEDMAASLDARNSLDNLENKTRFSLDVPVEQKGNLIAVHNLYDEKLKGALELGGFPMPSIAIVKAEYGHNSYGDISVIFDKDTIDPKKNRRNKVYTRDAYTPTFPRVEYKINADKVYEIDDELQEKFGEYFDTFNFWGIDRSTIEDYANDFKGNFADALEDKDFYKFAYIKDNNFDIDIPTKEKPLYKKLTQEFDNEDIKKLSTLFTKDELMDMRMSTYNSYEKLKENGELDKLLKEINSLYKEKYKDDKESYDLMKLEELPFDIFDYLTSAIYKYKREGASKEIDKEKFRQITNDKINKKQFRKWLNNLFDGVIEKKGIRNNKSLYTPSGNKRKWDALHQDYTLDNVVNEMRKEDATGVELGRYNIFGSSAEEFDSLQDIRDNSNRISPQDKDEYQKLKQEIFDEQYEIATQLRLNDEWSSSSMSTEQRESDIAEAIAKYKTPGSIKKWLSQWYDVTDETVNDILNLANKIRNMTVAFFEAKPQRAITFDEVKQIIIPDNLDESIVDELQKQNVPYTTYEAGNKEDRLNKLNAVEDVRFSLDVPVEEKGNLIAVHNRSVQDMLYAIEQGGIAMPSIAVTKADMLHTNFGDVSVLYPSGVIDPQYADNYVYSGDAYTPITPRVEYKTNEDMVRDFGREVREITKKLPGLYNAVSFYEANYQDRLNSTGSMYEVFKGNPAVIYAYLKEKNIPIRTPYKDNVYDETKEMAERLLRHYTLEELKSMSENLSKEKNLEVLNVLNQDRLNEYLKDHTQEEYDELSLFEKNMISMYDEEYHPSVRTENEIKDVVKYKTNGAKKVVDYDTLNRRLSKKINKANEEDYKQWLSSKLDKAVIKKQYRNNKDYYTRSGNPRSWNQLHDDYTLDNAIRIMREGAEKGEGQFGYNIFGSATVNYGTIDEIHADEDRLQERDYEEYKQLRSDINDELYRIANHIKPSTSWDVSSAAKDIAEAVATRKTKQGIKNWLSEWYNVEDSDIDDIMDLVQEVREMPTTYFEAKPQRAVTLDEIAKVVVPSDATKLITALEENNIPYNTYERDNEDSRREAVNSAVEEKDIRFSLDVPTTYALDDYDPFIDDDVTETKDSKEAFTNSIIKAANDVLNFNISDKQVSDIADKMISDYSSTVDKEFVTKNLRNIFSAMNSDNIQDMTNALINLSEEVVRQSEEIDPDEQANYDDFIKNMPKIKLSEEQKNEAINRMGDWNTVFGAMGRFLSNNTTTTLDGNVYWQICDNALEHNYVMDRDATDADQLMNIIEAVENMRPQSRAIFEGGDITDAALVTANEIMQQYYGYALKDKNANANLKEVKADLKKQVDDYKRVIGKQYQEQVNRLNKQLKSKDNELKQLRAFNTSEISKAISIEKARIATAEKNARADKTNLNKYIERQERNKHLKSIRNQAIRTIKMLENPTRNKFIPEVLQKPTIEMLQTFDFVTYRVRKNGELVPWGEEKGGEPTKTNRMWREKMEKLQSVLNNLEGIQDEEDLSKYGNNSSYLYNLSVELGDVTKGLLDQFLQDTQNDSVKISTLNSEKLKVLDDFMKSYLASINNAQEAMIDGNNVQLAKVGEKVVSELQELKSITALEGTTKKIIKDILNLDMLEPITLLSEMGGTMEKLYWHLEQGKDVRDGHIFDTEEAFSKAKEELNIDKNEPSKWETGLMSFKDGKLQLTPAQVMSLYAAYGRSQARHHIIFGGVKASDKGLRGKDKRLKKIQTKPVHLTPKDVEEIVNTLTPQQKALADFMVDYMSNEVSDWGNRVSQKRWGIKLFTESHYFPIKTYDATRNTIKVEGGNSNSLFALQNQGFTKPLVKDANNALVLENIFSVFAEHVAKMAAYDGYVIPINDFMRVFNYAESQETFVVKQGEEGMHREDTSVKEQVERVFGGNGTQYITKFIKNVNEDFGEGGSFNFLMDKYKAQAVLANMNVVVQQPTAYPRAAEVIDKKYLAQAVSVAGIHVKRKIRRCQSHNTLAKYKSKGYYETSIGQSMQQMITGTATTKEKINELAGALAGLMDDWTWSNIYYAAELKVQAEQKNLEKDSKEYFDAVNKVANEAFVKTQVVDSVFTKSQIMRSKDTADRILTAFMAEPTKYYNMLHRGWFKTKQTGKKKYIAKAVELYIVGQVLNAVVVSFMGAWRDDDEEKSRWDKFLNSLLAIDDIKKANGVVETTKALLNANLISGLLPFNMIPFVKEGINALSGYESKNMTTQAIYDIIGDAQKLVNAAEGKGNLQPYGYLYYAAHAFSLATGIPMASAIREIKDVYNNVNDLWDGDNIVKTETQTDRNKKYFAKSDSITEGAKKVYDDKLEENLEKGKTQEEAEKQAKSDAKGAITTYYKEKLIELKDTNMSEAVSLRAELVRAYTSLGDTQKEANTKIEKWFK